MEQHGGEERFVRVNRRDPCPICGKPDWCTYNSRYVFCMRVAEGAVGRARNGAYLHHRGTWMMQNNIPAPSPVADAPLASRERRDWLYRRFLGAFGLTPEHRDNLRARGLDDQEIRRRGYVTLPDATPEGRSVFLAQWMRRHSVQSLAGIPGFYLNDAGWTWVAMHGLCVPVRDSEGHILAFQVRWNEGGYMWFSSSNRRAGCCSGTPGHLATPHRSVAAPDVVWVTEGILKADVTSAIVSAPVVGVAGVAAWRAALPVLEKLGRRRVVVAYDRPTEKSGEYVRDNEKQLAAALHEAGYIVYRAVWDDHLGEGVDDALFAKKNGAAGLFEVKPW